MLCVQWMVSMEFFEYDNDNEHEMLREMPIVLSSQMVWMFERQNFLQLIIHWQNPLEAPTT